jgi:hypothetical protein
MARRPKDFYPTPAWATEELLKRVLIQGRVFECCVGDGAMSSVLLKEPGVSVFTNDVDTERPADLHGDAASFPFWSKVDLTRDKFDWVVTNPPFSQAMEILSNAHTYAKRGVAMLLRLSFLEPTEDRGSFLNSNPPDQLIVLPRISFTGDGKTDSVTCAWMVWDKFGARENGIVVTENPRFIAKAA